MPRLIPRCQKCASAPVPRSCQGHSHLPHRRRRLTPVAAGLCPVLSCPVSPHPPVSQRVSLASQTRFLPQLSLPGQPTRCVRTSSPTTDSCPRPDRSPEHLSGQPAHSSRHLLTQTPGTGSPPSCLAQETPWCPLLLPCPLVPAVESQEFVHTSLHNDLQGLTCVSAFSTLILWVEMKRSTSVRVWASPSEF